MKNLLSLPLFLWNERKRWHNISSDNGVRVYYGYESISEQGKFYSGGIIKYFDLQSAFPNTKVSPNILYLVSSALPPNVGLILSLARRSGALVVLNQNGVAYPGWHGPGWEQTNDMLGRVMHAVDYVIYQSRFCKEAADRFLGKFQGPHQVLHNSVDTEVFIPVNRPPLLGRRLRLLVSGSHSQAYRVMIPLQVMAILREKGVDACLRIAGKFNWELSEKDALRAVWKHIRELDLSEIVDVLGAYTQTDAPGLMQDADILLHAKYNDACPRLITEALSCGLPIVYSSSGGTPELVGDEAGVGLPAPVDFEKANPPDPLDMAEAVKLVAASYDRYTKAARQRAVMNLNLKHWLEEHRKIFISLVAR